MIDIDNVDDDKTLAVLMIIMFLAGVVFGGLFTLVIL